METLELVQLVKQGDSTAFEELYGAFAQRIFRYVRLKIHDRHEAEDLVQEIFIKAYRGISSLPLKDLNFVAWLYRVASNSINDHFRKRYRTPEMISLGEGFDIAGEQSVYKEVETSSEVETARHTFKMLPTLYKQVLELRFVQDFTPDEVADILHKSNLAVRLIQYRALKKVRLILNEKKEKSDYAKIKNISPV